MTTTAKTPMRKFSRHRTLRELRVECRKRGWRLDVRKYHSACSDYVAVHFDVGRVQGKALFSTINGNFFGELHPTGEWFASDSTTHKRKRWFRTLLNAFYLSA